MKRVLCLKAVGILVLFSILFLVSMFIACDCEEEEKETYDFDDLLADTKRIEENGGYLCEFDIDRQAWKEADEADSDCSNCPTFDAGYLRLMCEYAVDINGLTWTVCSTNMADREDDDEFGSYYCNSCFVKWMEFCGYDDWRLPTIEELQSLYDPDNPKPTESLDAYIMEPFILSIYLVFSSETTNVENGGVVFVYDFEGGEKQKDGHSYGLHRTALAVRP